MRATIILLLVGVSLVTLAIACGGSEPPTNTPAADPASTVDAGALKAGFGGNKPGSPTPWGADVADAGATKK